MSIKTQKGLVSFFDILGYTALKINELMYKLETFNMDRFLEKFEIRDRINDVSQEIKYAIISDSILIPSEFDVQLKNFKEVTNNAIICLTENYYNKKGVC